MAYFNWAIMLRCMFSLCVVNCCFLCLFVVKKEVEEKREHWNLSMEVRNLEHSYSFYVFLHEQVCSSTWPPVSDSIRFFCASASSALNALAKINHLVITEMLDKTHRFNSSLYSSFCDYLSLSWNISCYFHKLLLRQRAGNYIIMDWRGDLVNKIKIWWRDFLCSAQMTRRAVAALGTNAQTFGFEMQRCTSLMAAPLD